MIKELKVVSVRDMVSNISVSPIKEKLLGKSNDKQRSFALYLGHVLRPEFSAYIPRTELDSTWMSGDIFHERFPNPDEYWFYLASAQIRPYSSAYLSMSEVKAAYFDTLTRFSGVDNTINAYIDLLAAYKGFGVVLRSSSASGPIAPAFNSDPFTEKSIDTQIVSTPALNINIPYEYQNYPVVKLHGKSRSTWFMTKIDPWPTMGSSANDRDLYSAALLNLKRIMIYKLTSMTRDILSDYRAQSDFGLLYSRYSTYMNFLRSIYPVLNATIPIPVRDVTGKIIYTANSRVPNTTFAGPAIDFGSEWQCPGLYALSEAGDQIPLHGKGNEAVKFPKVCPCDVAIERYWREAISDSNVIGNIILIEAKLATMKNKQGIYRPAIWEGKAGFDTNLAINIPKSTPENYVFDQMARTPASNLLQNSVTVKTADFGGMSPQGLLDSLKIRSTVSKPTILSETRTAPPATPQGSAKKGNTLLWLAGGAAAAYLTYKASGG